jgi:hypothetical protein
MAKRRTQKTRPKEGKPIEIPVPKRKDFDRLLKRATKKPGEAPSATPTTRRPSK